MTKVKYFLLLLLVQVFQMQVYGQEYLFKTAFFETQLDHFSFTTNQTFSIKYLYNLTYWKHHANSGSQQQQPGPIFFYTGNEGDIELFAQNTGFMWDIAPEFNAALVFMEHRYYGVSLPFGNDSYKTPDKSGYLSSEQALADFAEFLIWFKQEYNVQNAPVIAFGGSYGGMLTTWFRMKYPHIVQGGIAGSAPILQFTGITDCDVFGKIVTNDFAKESKKCVETIRKSWNLINEFGKSVPGKNWLTENWKLCSPVQNQTDIDNLKNWLVNVYGNLAMVDYPYPSNFLNPLPAYPIKELCKKIPDSNLTDKLLLKSLFKGLSVYFNYTGNTCCLDVNQDAVQSLGTFGWDYQACTEMIMPMCYDGINDFFEPTPWDFKSYEADCIKRWGIQPRQFMAETIYGGRSIMAASNIVFSNGLLDPWSGGGVLTNLSSSLIAVIIPEGAHHLDLRASNPNDPLSVIQARDIEKAYIKKWIEEYHLQNKQWPTPNGSKKSIKPSSW